MFLAALFLLPMVVLASDQAPAENAPKPAVAAATEESPEKAEARKTWLRNRIRWSTASEVDNFGYDVYRSLEEKGTFAKVNTKPILGHGTTDEPQSYEFYDDTIDEGIAYWYYVESISIDGEREIFTPIFQAKAKFPPAEKSTEKPAN